MPVGQQLGPIPCVAGPDELGRGRERRVCGVDQRLRNQAQDRLFDPCVVKRLGQPIADHALGLRDKVIERVGAGQDVVGFALQREHADLWSVAVTDHHIVVRRQRRNRLGGGPQVRQLDGGVGLVPARQQCVTPQRDHDPHRHHGSRTERLGHHSFDGVQAILGPIEHN
jgi:hypothetical protein